MCVCANLDSYNPYNPQYEALFPKNRLRDNSLYIKGLQLSRNYHGHLVIKPMEKSRTLNFQIPWKPA